MNEIIREHGEYDENNREIYHKCTFLNGDTIIKKYDKNGNKIYHKQADGKEIWREYDYNNKCIHHKESTDYEWWKEYDDNGLESHFKRHDGYEEWYKNGLLIRKKYPSFLKNILRKLKKEKQ